MSTQASGAERRGGIKFFYWLTENTVFKNFILACIIANAATLGIDAHFGDANPFKEWTDQADKVFLAIFTAELVLEFLAQGPRRYVRDGWNIFDVIVVGISYLSMTAFSALRTLRVLRVLRLVSNVPQLRRVVEALIGATPGILAAVMILIIVFFIGAVMATTLFGATHKEWFGDLGASALTLFQIAQFDGWGEVVRDLNQTYPYAWVFLVLFDVVAAFAVLNLFIGVLVDAVQEVRGRELEATAKRVEEDVHGIEATEKVIATQQRQQTDLQLQLLTEVRALRDEVARLKQAP